MTPLRSLPSEAARAAASATIPSEGVAEFESITSIVVSGSSVFASSWASQAALYRVLSLVDRVTQRTLEAFWLALRKIWRQSSGDADEVLKESGSSRKILYASEGVISTQSR